MHSLAWFRRRWIAVDAQQEVGIDEHPLEGELNAGIERLARAAAAVEKPQQRLDVGRGDRPAVRALRETRQNPRGARALFSGRFGLADENRATARCIRTDDAVRACGPANLDRVDVRVI